MQRFRTRLVPNDLAVCSLLLCVVAPYVSAQEVRVQSDALYEGFVAPPDSARPRVWWHWMNGNVAKQGIKLDLEWMHRVGIAGFQNFDASLGTPQVVDKRLSYMTPEWKDAFQYSIELADKLHMEVGIAASPGWSETGGPWVHPEQAMKKYVWSETLVEGGKPVSLSLPKPPAVAGPYLDMIHSADGHTPASFYVDTALTAYRMPEAATDPELPVVTTSGGTSGVARLTDGPSTAASTCRWPGPASRRGFNSHTSIPGQCAPSRSPSSAMADRASAARIAPCKSATTARASATLRRSLIRRWERLSPLPQ